MDSGILNEAQGMEFPPVYDDISKFLADTEKIVEQEQEDPTKASYFLRLDTKTVVKTQTEYQACVKQHVGLKVIPYSYACHALKEEEAKHRAKIKARRKQKIARKARKRNR